MSLESTIQVLADTADERDSYTGGHQRRVASICVRIATDMGLSPDRIHGLHLAASIHDLGKIGMPSELLFKNVVFPWPIAQMVLQHHERMDGSGYPQGLKGDALLLESRILAVADVVEAMASHRPYRPALGIEAALDEIVRHRGELFDADVVDACLRVFREQGYVIVG
jgi:HD-GYP domain-containing protein (c-di-GMP phosphodiesterase class II)